MTDSAPLAPSSASEPVPSRPTTRSTAGWVVSLVLAAVVGALLFAGGFLAAGSSSGSCAGPNQAFAPLCEAYQKLKAEYVDKLDDTKLAEGAIQGMFQYGVADPFSGYMAPQQYNQALGDLSGKFEGIGAEMSLKNLKDPANLDACAQLSETCVLVVVKPIKDSPAEQAGIRAGDIVTAVNGTSVNGSTMSDQIAKVRGKAGTDVTLGIKRGASTLSVTVTRAEITMSEVETRMLDNDIGYIALHGFSESSPDQFHQELKGLLDRGAQKIIFDLRGNPGGYIEAARTIASEFVDTGTVFTQESAGDAKTWTALPDYGLATKPSIPVVVLVDNGSASASEIVSAALKELGRATIIGQHTFGKNTVQVWAPLENDGGVRITISRWFTPDHHSVHPDGVQPDIVVDVPAGTPPEQDLVLQRAIEVLDKRAVGAQPQTPASAAPSIASPSSGETSYDTSGLTRSAA